MNDTTDSRRAERDGPRYLAFGDAIRIPAGASEEIVIDPISGRAHVLSVEQAAVLAAIRGERTLEGHVVEAAQRLGHPPEALRGLVMSLIVMGLLPEEGEARGLLRRAARPESGPGAGDRLLTMGVPTRGRAEALVECVRTHAAAARERGRRVTCVVADSSEAADRLDGTGSSSSEGASPRSAARFGGADVRLAGRSERARFAPILAERAGVDPAIVEYALFGDPQLGSDAGANRNALLLDAAGELLMMTDDDVRARAARPPDDGAAPAAALTLASGDPYEAWFAEPGEAVVPDERWEAPDPFAVHEALLGADVARAALDAGEGLAMIAGAAFYQRLVRRGGRVVTTQLGCAGDHGMGASFSLLLFRGASRERLTASRARFEDAFTGRRILRSTRGATISDTAFCMSMSLGVDARSLVPPFSPVGRNADGLFGVMVRSCLDDAYTAFLPWAVEHAPPGGRSAAIDQELAIAGRGEVNDLLRLGLGGLLELRGTDAGARLQDAGRALQQLAARPRDAERLFQEQVTRAVARLLVQIDRALVEHRRRPSFWAEMADMFAARLREVLSAPAAWLPRDLVKARGEEAARDLLLSHARQVGRLFEAWPALFEAARELRANGVRLSVPAAG